MKRIAADLSAGLYDSLYLNFSASLQRRASRLCLSLFPTQVPPICLP